MTASLDLPGNSLVAMTRDSLLALRAALFLDVCPGAASLLQEAGYAGGQALFGGLYAVHHGVAQQVLEGRQHALQNLAVQFAGGALDHQLGLFAGVGGGLAHDA